MINNVQLTTTETSILTSGAAEVNAVLSIIFCNTSASSKFITLYVYSSGGSAGDNTTVVKNLEIPAEDTWIWTGDEKIILEASGVISGIADVASSITATINYYTL